MKIKRILSLVLAAALVTGMNCMTSMAAHKKKISNVKLTIEAVVLPEGLISGQEADVTVKSSKIEVGDYRFINDGFKWGKDDIPRMEVTLYADDDYYFQTTDDSFTIEGGTYVSEKKEDYKQTLTVTIDLPRVYEFMQPIESAQWSSLTKASWSSSVGAGSYEIKLYRDGNKLGTVKTTTDTCYDFYESMTKSGNYSFRVRPVNKQNPDNAGEWIDSASQYIDEKAAGQNCNPGNKTTAVQRGWKQDSTGWWYQNSDGSYTVNNWQNINGKWYYFNENGYMATGWIQWNGKQYYCDSESGQMLIDTWTPDGSKVGTDGAKIS